MSSPRRFRGLAKCTFLVALMAAVTSLMATAADKVPLAAVNSEWIECDPWLSPDGYTLYFSSNRGGGDFDIYEARWDGLRWTAPRRLSARINSEVDETQPSLSGDGHWLCFVSFRGRFVRGPWLSQRQPDGSWGTAELVHGHSEPEIHTARIGRDGRSIFFTGRSKGGAAKPYGMCMPFDAAGRFWRTPFAHGGEAPSNDVPGARWRFFAEGGDIYAQATGVHDPADGSQKEVVNAIASSSLYGREDEDYWVSEAQNLVDELADTSWVSRAGMPVRSQWVLLGLNGPVRYVPGLSRIHALRIHSGPVEPVSIEARDKRHPGKTVVEKVIPQPSGPGTRPKRLRILGGMDIDALRELAVADLDPTVSSPWHDVPLAAPVYLRYVKLEVLETVDPEAPYVAFNEVELLGAGLSARRPQPRVSANADNTITVDGAPFFPVYIYYAHSRPQIAAWGFTTTLETYDVAPDTARLAILDRAADLGLKVIGHVPWVETPAERKRARNQLLAARHHPALRGYLMSDESGHNEEVMRQDARRAEFIRRYDPHHFTMLNDLYPQTYPRSSRIVDVFSIDPYPHIVGQPYAYQAFAVDAAYQSVQHAKPVFVVNASWGPIISPVENRLNVYLALIHGAKGISWYEVGVCRTHPDHWASILRCVREINQLMPVLVAPPTPPDSPLVTHTTIESPAARIDAMIKAVDGEVWLLAANCEPRAAHVRLTLGWGERITVREVMADAPEVWSADRNDFTPMHGWPPPEDHAPISNARPVELVFPAYGVRVFRMRPTGPIDPIHAPRGDGTPLAMVNESLARRTVAEIGALRDAGKVSQAKERMNQFWNQYRDRLSADDLTAMMDELSDAATVEEILAGYGHLADRYPDAQHWPTWVFTIVTHLVRAQRLDAARTWLARLIDAHPDSLWRANAEVLLDPAAARRGLKPWAAAPKLTEPPVIDGELRESVWQRRIAFANTVFLDASKHPQPTEFAVAYDEEALYVAVRLIEPALDKIRMRIDKDDRAVWADDSIVLYFDPTLGYARYAQFIFNAAGVMWDGWADRHGCDGGGSLHADVTRKARITDGAWQIEVRIPFGDLGVSCPAPGQVWGLGLQRWRHVEGALFTVWGNEKGTSLDNRTETFGFLVFE